MAPPTMTLEEFADLEMAKLMEREKRSAAIKSGEIESAEPPLRYSQLESEGLEDDLAKVDLATLADRDWDAFREAHKKGSGNKMGKMF